MKKFIQLLEKDNPMLSAIKRRGFTEPSEIQVKSIKEILAGKDVVAGASTGSGKTLAFAAGLIKNAKKDYGIQGLVLTPTRELAEQIINELIDFSEKKDLDVLAVYGGVSINNQISRLKYADIVVGTPGRILDHINRNTIDLSRVNTLVLDEADRMLDMGFRKDVFNIIKECPRKRQTLLFSATLSQDVIDISKRYMKDAVEVSAKSHVDPEKLEQVYYDVHDHLKFSLLKHLLENEESNLVMIFCNTRRNVDFVTNNLEQLNIKALPIHGGFTQDKRNKMLEDFNSSKVKILVATDVAARGLDIKGVSHIYNYDCPPTLNEYIHRIGRTARAGNEGKVINIICSRDYENFSNINTDKFEIKRLEAPYLKRITLQFIPNKRNFRGNNRRPFRNNNRNNDSRRSYGRDSRSSSGNNRRSYRRDSRSGSSDNRRSFSRNNRSNDNRRTSNRDNRSDNRKPFSRNNSNRSKRY